MATVRTKAQLEAELEHANRMLQHKTQLLEEASETISEYEDRIALGADAPVADATSGPKDEPSSGRMYAEPELRSDPYSRHNPHQPIAHPAGYILSWKNPKYRGSRGWEGWIKIEWDDEIGRNLTKYLNEAPDRMEGAIDNYVRRGDLILCRLPEAYYRSRQAARQEVIDRYDRGDSDKSTDNPKLSLTKDRDGTRIGGRSLLS